MAQFEASAAADPNVRTHLSELDVQDLIDYIEEIEMELRQRDEALENQSKEIEWLLAERRGAAQSGQSSSNSQSKDVPYHDLHGTSESSESAAGATLISDASSESRSSERLDLLSLESGSCCTRNSEEESETPRSDISGSESHGTDGPSPERGRPPIDGPSRGRDDRLVRTALNAAIAKLRAAEGEVARLRGESGGEAGKTTTRGAASRDGQEGHKSGSWGDRAICCPGTRETEEEDVGTCSARCRTPLPPSGAPNASKTVQLLRRCCLPPTASGQIATTRCIL